MDPAPAGGASENTPLLSDPGAGHTADKAPEPQPSPQRPSRQPSGRGPFYGALKRTNDVARALANPWPKARLAE
jgi:hypothetical protein